MAGKPIAKPGGGTYQHLKDQDALRGLRNLIEDVKARLKSGKLSAEERAALEKTLGEASRIYDHVERSLGGGE